MNNGNEILSEKFTKRLLIISIVIIFIGIGVYYYFEYKSIQPIGGRDIFDISNSTEYSKIIGQEYETKMDLIFYNTNPEDDLLWLSIPGGSIFPTIEEVRNANKLPIIFKNRYKIHGILPSGSKFKIVKILKIRYYKLGEPYDNFPYLFGKIMSDGKFKAVEAVLDLRWKKDSDELLEKYVVRLK